MVIKKISNNIHCLHPGSFYQELQWPSLPFLFFFKWPCSFQFTIGYFANQKKKLLSHLFFASDSLIFCKASLAERESLQRVLKVYEQASGQQLNWAKTSLFFTSNASREVQEEIKRRFGAQVIKQHGSTWVYKEVLIKAVTRAIPTYIMSCFKILDYLCEDLTSMIRNFLWGQRKEEKKIAWL